MQQVVKDEITRQLILLKKQMDMEHQNDLIALKKEILQIIEQKSETLADNVNKQMTLTTSNGISKELAVSISNQTSAIMGREIYKKIVNNINTKVMPKIDAMIENNAYHNQDTTELVTDYRRSVHAQYAPSNNNKMIDNGKGTGPFAPNVELFFNENDP